MRAVSRDYLVQERAARDEEIDILTDTAVSKGSRFAGTRNERKRISEETRKTVLAPFVSALGLGHGEDDRGRHRQKHSSSMILRMRVGLGMGGGGGTPRRRSGAEKCGITTQSWR